MEITRKQTEGEDFSGVVSSLAGIMRQSGHAQRERERERDDETGAAAAGNGPLIPREREKAKRGENLSVPYRVSWQTDTGSLS